MTDRGELIRYKTNVRRYLAELGCYFGREVSEAELVPISKSSRLLSEASKNVQRQDAAANRFTLPFAEKAAPRFRQFLQGLAEASESSAYAWTHRSAVCGLCRIGSVLDLDPSFPFNCDENGLLVLYPARLDGRLVLDFSEDEPGLRTLEVEAEGCWAPVAY